MVRRRRRRATRTRRYDPIRRRTRRVRRRRYDPYIPYDPRRRVRRSGRRLFRRRYDPPYGKTGLFGAILRPLTVILGGFLHNMLVSRGIGNKIVSVGNVHMTHAGIGMGAAGVLMEGMTRSKYGELMNHIGAGALSEGMTAPDIEGVAKSGVAVASKGGGGLMGDSYIPLGAYATAL